jgi:hypothetical protein
MTFHFCWRDDLRYRLGQSLVFCARASALRRDSVETMIDLELARQTSELMRARAEAWQRFIRVVHGGPRPDVADGCDHDPDLLGKCRLCGEQISPA